METLGKDARRLLMLAKGGHQPPVSAKLRMRERLDTKLAATVVLGATGLVSRTTLAQTLLPATKALLVSMVFVGAAGVGYVAAPAMRRDPLRAASSAVASAQHGSVHGSRTPLSTHSGGPPLSTNSSVVASPDADDARRLSTSLGVASASSTRPGMLPPANSAKLGRTRITSANPTHETGSSVVSLDLPIEGAVLEQPRPNVEAASDPANSLPPTSPNAAGQLVLETALVRQAHQAILRGAPGTAIDLLAKHQRQFPNGVLQQERDTARIVAYCKLGRLDDARIEWLRFETLWPASPLIERIRASCPVSVVRR